MRKVGVLGGTFDPPHIAHLVIARRAVEKLGLGEVIFVPNNIPPHKVPPVAPAQHRLNMIKIAIECEKDFVVSDCEIKRGGISYTVDTLKFLREQEGWQSEFFLLIGEDSARKFNTWKEYTKILEMAKVAWFPRNKENDKRKNEDKDEEEMMKRFIKVEAEILDISSTRIRECLKAGLSVKWLVPDPVLKYIKENKLYTL